jgi:hypothetical protein
VYGPRGGHGILCGEAAKFLTIKDYLGYNAVL